MDFGAARIPRLVSVLVHKNHGTSQYFVACFVVVFLVEGVITEVGGDGTLGRVADNFPVIFGNGRVVSNGFGNFGGVKPCQGYMSGLPRQTYSQVHTRGLSR